MSPLALALCPGLRLLLAPLNSMHILIPQPDILEAEHVLTNLPLAICAWKGELKRIAQRPSDERYFASPCFTLHLLFFMQLLLVKSTCDWKLCASEGRLTSAKAQSQPESIQRIPSEQKREERVSLYSACTYCSICIWVSSRFEGKSKPVLFFSSLLLFPFKLHAACCCCYCGLTATKLRPYLPQVRTISQ